MEEHTIPRIQIDHTGEEKKEIGKDINTIPMKKKTFPWLAVAIPGSILLILLLLAGIFLIPMGGVISAGGDVMRSGNETLDALKSQDIGKTKTKIEETKGKLEVLDKEYGKIAWFQSVPFVGLYVADGKHAINAGFAAITAGQKAIEALEPNADLLGLKGKSTFVSGTAEDRLQMAVKTMSALTPKINEMAQSVDVLRKELSYINPARYPVSFRGKEIRAPLAQGINVIEETANLFVNAQPLLMSLPSLLGEPNDKRYLVLFQNDKELRPTGGFLTAYARFRMVKGKPILEKADDIYTLDKALTKKYPAPKEILTFHKGVYNLYIRDSNLSPDFKESMKQFEEMYNQTSGKEVVDGIIAVDTHVLVEVLKIVGPIGVYGITFSAETDKRCDCPKAIYELEDYSSRPVGYVRTDRKDIIGVLLHEILKMALGVSPSKYWGSLFQMLISEINQKHVIAYFHDESAQKAAESFNMAGRIMTKEETAALLKYKEGQGWDYLHINNSNMAGAKANMFVNEKITKDVTVGTDGTITTKLTVDYKNPYEGSDCGLESGGLCLNAPLRNWVRVYSPIGSKLVSSSGSQSPKDNKPETMTTYDSLGKTVFEGFVIVNPMGTAKLELTYTSPVKPDGTYKLLIQKQPGTEGQEVLLKMGGKDKKKIILTGDTEITL